MMVHVRGFKKSRIFEKNPLLGSGNLESDRRLVPGIVIYAERLSLNAEPLAAEVLRLFGPGERETQPAQRRQMRHQLFLTNRSMPRRASSVIRAIAFPWTPASSAASKVIPSM